MLRHSSGLVRNLFFKGAKHFSCSPKASATNYVPTVNVDLSGQRKVLNHAPEDQIGRDFSTKSMNIIDKVLSMLGTSKDGLGRSMN